MYSWELKEFILKRNYYLGGDDLIKAISLEENPQLNHITYNFYDNKYFMWDKEENDYSFTPMPYEEALQRKLIKKQEE